MLRAEHISTVHCIFAVMCGAHSGKALFSFKCSNRELMLCSKI